MQLTETRLRFGAALRLRSKLQFEAVYARGRRIDDRYFGLRLIPNQQTHARLGLAVAVKMAGNAVARNRLRRLIRESFRLAQRDLPGVDVVVAAKFPAREAPPQVLRASLATLWQRVASSCATSSNS